SWVACRLKTGRTHQIRVHMESIGLPLIGDPLYRNKLPKPKEDGSVLNSFDRQALHASRLGLIHPVTKQTMEWFAEPPQDFRDLMDELGFGPWDRPSEVFGDPVVMIDNDELSENQKVVGKISSWDDFDFGDDDEDADSNWKIERTK
ncbi:MAG: RluA family pseudouridine synthase, partial [Parasutterella excrementihominis]